MNKTDIMDPHTNFSVKTLDELNYEERVRDIPLYAFIIFVFVTGIFGNTVTLYIFIKSYTRSTFRSFIIYLSSVDLLSCIIGIPIEIVTLIFGLKNVNTILCKFLAFVTALPTITSVLLLFVIAVDRYRKICRPFLWQITSRSARNIFIACVAISFGCSLLRFITYGSQKTTFAEYNVIMFTCEVTKEMENTPIAIISLFLMGFLFLFNVTSIATLYCCIAVRIRKQINTKRKMTGKAGKEAVSKKSIDKLNTGTEGDKDKISVIETAEYSNVKQVIETSCDTNQQSVKTSNNSKQTNNNRSAFVMFIVTLAFFLSFTPSVPLMLAKMPIQSNFVRSIFKFFFRSYLLNCVVNPVIYGLFDPQFRRLCKMLFSCKKVSIN